MSTPIEDYAPIGDCTSAALVAANGSIGDPQGKRLIGNFPQAFSHLALINSAYNLTRTAKPLHQRAQDEHAPPEELAAAAD